MPGITRHTGGPCDCTDCAPALIARVLQQPPCSIGAEVLQDPSFLLAPVEGLTLCGPFRGRRGRRLRCPSIVAVLVTTSYLYTNAIHHYTNTVYWNREVWSWSTMNTRSVNEVSAHALPSFLGCVVSTGVEPSLRIATESSASSIEIARTLHLFCHMSSRRQPGLSIRVPGRP